MRLRVFDERLLQRRHIGTTVPAASGDLCFEVEGFLNEEKSAEWITFGVDLGQLTVERQIPAPRSSAGRAVARQAGRASMQCFYCKETIKDDAVVCRYCGAYAEETRKGLVCIRCSRHMTGHGDASSDGSSQSWLSSSWSSESLGQFRAVKTAPRSTQTAWQPQTTPTIAEPVRTT